MANILYGVSGEGSGHSSRAKEIITYLEKQGHKVKVVSYDRGYANLSPIFDVEKIFGLNFVYKDNKVKQIKTLLKSISRIPKVARSIKKVSKIVKTFQPQIIFSDFEPVSAIVASYKKIPLISIDNQHVITNTKIEYPKKYRKDVLATKAVIKMMIRSAKAYLVTDFFGTEIKNKKTFIFPPILRQEIFDLEVSEKDYILVYLTSSFKPLIPVLKKINQKFIVYGFNMDMADDNLIFKKPSQVEFLRDLAGCRGVIASAGFSLITESLYLKKPYLALPVKKQFEQVLNGYYLEKLGYGKFWDELNQERIEAFLFNLDLYKKNLQKYEKNDNSKIFKKIDELIEMHVN